MSKELELQRAKRILFNTNIIHESIDKIYESLVDREFDFAKKEILTSITELRLLLKSIEDDDF